MKDGWKAVKQFLFDSRSKNLLIKKYVQKVDAHGKEVFGKLENGYW